MGRFRPHHGFVFGSATSMLTWLCHFGPSETVLDAIRFGLVIGSVLGFWNIIYDIKAIRSGILKVYNQPWAERQPDWRGWSRWPPCIIRRTLR